VVRRWHDFSVILRRSPQGDGAERCASVAELCGSRREIEYFMFAELPCQKKR
jgi:hypothetical protein